MPPARRLRVELAENPFGLDVPQPGLSWAVPSPSMESAYRVLVASTEGLLSANRGDLWDSGRITGSRSPVVPYAGLPLLSSQRCHWQVEVWDGQGRSLGRSEPAWWETALMKPGDWKATWIGCSSAEVASPLLRTEFEADCEVARARVYVSGLGYHELYINGERVGDHVLSPSFTNYDATVHYVCHDVTRLLRRRNALAVALGRGWFGFMADNFFDWRGAPWHAEPRLLLQLVVEFVDGTSRTIVSDEAWRCTPGPTVVDSVFGEIYDARLEPCGWTSAGYDDRDWARVSRTDAPLGRLRAESQEPIRVIETLEPVEAAEGEWGRCRYDFGINVSGWARIRVRGERGATVQVRYGENLVNFETPWTVADGAADLSPYTPSPGAEFQRDTYTLAGAGTEEWEPRFSYKGFRWAEVTADPDATTIESIQARVVHSSVAVTGKFDSADPLLGLVHQICRRALLNNLHGLPTDTPIYEKAGWTGDAMITVRSALDDLDVGRLYTKYGRDMLDAQLPTGEVPPFAPTAGWGYIGHPGGAPLNYDRGPTPDFDAAYMVIPWELYRHLGDERILADHYDSMTGYLSFVARYADGHVLRWGLGDWKKPGCMDEGGPGENAPPHAPSTSPALIATAWYFRMAQIVSSVATILGKSDDATSYRHLAESIAAEFNGEFFDQKASLYRTKLGVGYSQTSNALPLALGLVPDDRRPSVVGSLVADLEARDAHLDTGIQGTRVVLPVLSDNGFVDLAYRIASQTSFPSWGWWIGQGATTCWEKWGEEARSFGHHFFGSIVEWFYEHLVGITPAEPGFRVVRVAPRVPAGLRWARGRIDTVRGPVSCRWEQDAVGVVTAEVTIPGNTVGLVELRGRAPVEVGPGTHIIRAPRAAGKAG